MAVKTIALVGAGRRAQFYARMLVETGRVRVVAIAEPREDNRALVKEVYGLPDDRIFCSWQEFVKQPTMADAVYIGTSDREHAGPAIASMKLGYDVLLEKPMAVTLDDCRQIEATQRQTGAILGVCHSLRYANGFRKVKDILDSGVIGRAVSINLTEQVAWWHQAHAYVRGNWSNESRSTFMLLAKSCHDIDYLHYLVGRKCVSVSSFGALTYFRPENAPADSGERCVACKIETTCPYSAIKRYVNTNRNVWPADIVSLDHSRESHLEAIRTGPYGRCVWKCDNDVVDHQTVNMLFEDDITAVFTMTAFTRDGGRMLRIHGTMGELYFDEHSITIKTFGSNDTTTIQIGAEDGHGGGDQRIADTWLDALFTRDDSLIVANAQESLKTHTVVFAAEKSRRERKMINLNELP